MTIAENILRHVQGLPGSLQAEAIDFVEPYTVGLIPRSLLRIIKEDSSLIPRPLVAG